MSNQNSFPSEVIDLPSKGLLYPKESPLSTGTVEMKYMTAKEEDILTNSNYIQRGVVIDKLLQSLIISDIDYGDLLVGDKNALLVGSRILGYGKEYEVTYGGTKHTVDLSTIEHKQIDYTLMEKGENRFSYTLPVSDTSIEFKFLTHRDEQNINEELEGLKKINKEDSSELVTRFRHMIISVNGDDKRETVNDFVSNHFLARDSRAFRKYIQEIQPDIDLRFYPEGGPEGGVEIPIGIDFFWPDI